jgi:hypothetical protein
MNQHTEPCGCAVTTERGHVHTKMCDQHKRETFAPKKESNENRDLIGG